MPELPEVETVKRALAPYIIGKRIVQVCYHHPMLRYPLDDTLLQAQNQTITHLKRRSKYLIAHLQTGYLLLHLGMSGRLYWQQTPTKRAKHDHLEWYFEDQSVMRLHDPRRFGAALYDTQPLHQHPLLKDLGPEPLGDHWDANRFHQSLKRTRTPIKTALMHGKHVVGVGNIYANEALFLAKIHPLKQASTLSLAQATTLIAACRQVLEAAIEAGGTTLKDFRSSDGSKGYFQQRLNVYHQTTCPCGKRALTICKVSGRHTAFCEACQQR